MNLIFIMFWAVCGFITYGISFAYLQRTSPPKMARDEYWEDMGFSMLWGLFGPVSLLIAFFLSGLAHKGFKIR